MRIPAPTDFSINVPDVGNFVFGKRKMRDDIDAHVEFARIIDGVTPTQWLNVVAGAVSDLKVLTVSAPRGWDLDEMELSDDEVYDRLLKVHTALRNRERSFRKGTGAVSEDGGAGAGADGRVPVPPEVQPAG